MDISILFSEYLGQKGPKMKRNQLLSFNTASMIAVLHLSLMEKILLASNSLIQDLIYGQLTQGETHIREIMLIQMTSFSKKVPKNGMSIGGSLSMKWGCMISLLFGSILRVLLTRQGMCILGIVKVQHKCLLLYV